MDQLEHIHDLEEKEMQYPNIKIQITGKVPFLQEKETNIITTLISIKTMLMPYIEVLHHEPSIVETLMSRYANISSKEGLVDLLASLEI